MAEEVRIDLKSTADTSGFDKMGAASKEAGIGIGAASKESKAMAQELGRSVEVGSASVGLFQNIATASQGGAAGLAAAARAGLGFGQVMKGMLAGAGPIGIALAAVGVAAGALVTLFTDTGKSAKDAADKMEELNKLKLEGVTAEQKALADEAARAAKAIQDELTAMDRIAERRTARLIEEEKAKNLPKEIEARNITRIRRAAEDEKLGRQQSALDRTAEVMEGAASDAYRAQDRSRIERDMFAALKARRDAARIEFADAYNAQRAAIDVGASPDEIDAATSRKGSARIALTAAESEYVRKVGGKDSDGTLFAERLKTLNEVLKSNTEAYKAANEAARDARAKADQERSTQGAVAGETNKLRAAEDKNTRGETPEEKRARQQRIDQLKRRGRSVVDNQIAGGAEIDEATYTEAFGAAAWAKRPKSLYSAPAGQAGGESSKTAEAIGDAAKAAESMDTGAGTAEKAAELKKNMEASAAAQKQFADATQAGLAAAAAVSSELAASVSQAMSATMQTRAELSQLKAQIATMRNRSAQ